MARLDPGMVVAAADYERVRPDYRRHISRERSRRRLRVGEDCTLQFETCEFALWHVHELLRVEGWTRRRVARTVEDVEPWCPGPGELIATVMVDTCEARRVDAVARALLESGALTLETSAGVARGIVIEPGFIGEPVWYLRFELTSHWGASLSSGCWCRAAWDAAPIELSAETRAALAADLAARRPPTLHRFLASDSPPWGSTSGSGARTRARGAAAGPPPPPAP